MTIKGVKKHLQNNISELDEVNNKTINNEYIKIKLNRISAILKNFKKDG